MAECRPAFGWRLSACGGNNPWRPLTCRTDLIFRKYDVTSHTNSAEAFKAFSANPGDYDLVITDMAMPNMNGEQLARQLIDIREDISVILCTGFSKTMTTAKAASIGIKAFLNKLVSLSDVASEIRRVLNDAKSLKNREINTKAPKKFFSISRVFL